MNPYEELGIDHTALPHEIRTAYRAKAQRCHPDKGEAGDPAMFQRVQEAWEILKDPERKERYDRTGTTDKPKYDIEGHLADLFNVIIEKNMTGDLVEVAKGQVLAAQQALHNNEANVVRQTQQLKGKLGRVASKGDHNIYEGILTQKLATLTKNHEAVKHELTLMGLVLAALDDYEDTSPDARPATTTGGTGSHTFYIRR